MSEPKPESMPQRDLNNAGVDLTRGGAASPSPKQPNDRDEHVGSTAPETDATVAQAKKDLDRGLADTSRAEATDAAYQKQRT